MHTRNLTVLELLARDVDWVLGQMDQFVSSGAKRNQPDDGSEDVVSTKR